jgi:heat shock protein HslJ
MSKFLRISAALSLVALTGALWGGTTAQAAPVKQSTLPAEVLQTQWILQYFNTDAKTANQDVSSSRITLKFESDGTLSGSGGCNNYSSTYTVNGQNMTISDKLVSTMMACEQSVMTNESLYFRLLTTVNAYALNGGKLDLIYADGHNAMTFTSRSDRGGQGSTTGMPDDVIQTQWTLQYFDSNAKLGQDVSSAGITLKFEADGSLSGFAGCNNYTGTYIADSTSVTIDNNIGATRMACPAAQTLLESKYLQLLPGGRTYTATTNELQLIYGTNGTAMVFIPTAAVSSLAPEPAATGASAGGASAGGASAGGASATGPTVGMPQTGEGNTPFLALLALLSAFGSICLGYTLRNRQVKVRADK